LLGRLSLGLGAESGQRSSGQNHNEQNCRTINRQERWESLHLRFSYFWTTSTQLHCCLARTYHRCDAKAARLKANELDDRVLRGFAFSRLCGVVFRLRLFYAV
jgi:hypothetical protein